MERNTVTTLGALRDGDRFTFPRRVDVWQVTGEHYGGNVMINQFMPNGAQIHKYNIPKPKKTIVKFLRHTKPEPGEQCLLKDLSSGDVFYKSDDLITEYSVKGEAEKYWMIQCLCNGNIVEISGDEIVTLVNKSIPA